MSRILKLCCTFAGIDSSHLSHEVDFLNWAKDAGGFESQLKEERKGWCRLEIKYQQEIGRLNVIYGAIIDILSTTDSESLKAALLERRLEIYFENGKMKLGQSSSAAEEVPS